METTLTNSIARTSSIISFRVCVGASLLLILLLASLHLLSPQYNPAWRVISEYANGRFAWVLSLMFIMGALSNWTLAYGLWSQIRTRGGKIGLYCLIGAGAGAAMAAVFDIKHPLHTQAGLLGVLCPPAAALLLSVALTRNESWRNYRRPLMTLAHLSWISLVVFLLSFILMITTYINAGGDMSASSENIKTLPPGVIAVVGYTNRIMFLINIAWPCTVAWLAIYLQSSRFKADSRVL